VSPLKETLLEGMGKVSEDWMRAHKERTGEELSVGSVLKAWPRNLGEIAKGIGEILHHPFMVKAEDIEEFSEGVKEVVRGMRVPSVGEVGAFITSHPLDVVGIAEGGRALSRMFSPRRVLKREISRRGGRVYSEEGLTPLEKDALIKGGKEIFKKEGFIVEEGADLEFAAHVRRSFRALKEAYPEVWKGSKLKVRVVGYPVRNSPMYKSGVRVRSVSDTPAVYSRFIDPVYAKRKGSNIFVSYPPPESPAWEALGLEGRSKGEVAREFLIHEATHHIQRDLEATIEDIVFKGIGVRRPPKDYIPIGDAEVALNAFRHRLGESLYSVELESVGKYRALRYYLTSQDEFVAEMAATNEKGLLGRFLGEEGLREGKRLVGDYLRAVMRFLEKRGGLTVFVPAIVEGGRKGE